MKSINVIVAGATGYIGLQLIKLLTKHPFVNIKRICAQKSIGKNISNFDKYFKKYRKLPKISLLTKKDFKNIDIIFTALPNGEAQKISKYLNNSTKLIDLSADFRLSNYKLYEKWYNKKHYARSLIKNSIYSIPELVNKDLKKYNIISCPGCYPTSIQIPIIPLINNKLIKTKNIIIDSKSGYSGAGKNLHKKFKYKNIYKSISAYGIGFHKHVSEIEQEINKKSNKSIKIIFTPHLTPMFRGILSTIYLDISKNTTPIKIHNYLKKYYKNESFVKIKKFNIPIGTGEVMNTNFCHISICKSRFKNKILILSAIDNLIKGGAGQAVQNLNLIYGFNKVLGLKQ